ncbi:FAD binding domain-containing protein [Sarocladium implicatum]|nr:FAD binding domain-containing protein [Sarocladium implicatum]
MTTLLETAGFSDYGLLLAIVLSTIFVYNKGTLLPATNPHEKILFEKPQKQDDANAARTLVTRDLGERVRESDARFLILWGSQSGTAENIAHRLGRDIHQRLKCKAFVGDLSDYEPATLSKVPEHVFLILVMSTYGEGDPSYNAQDFVSYYSSLSSDSLSHLRFAAFGCGNSSYRFFNKVIHDTTAALQRCGAKALVPVGTGDEARKSTHEDFKDWKDSFFACLATEFSISAHDTGYEPSVTIDMLSPDSIVRDDDRKDNTRKSATDLPVTLTQPMGQYADETRSCVLVKLDLARHPQIKYRTGDHIAVWPRNPVEEVNRLLRVLERESQQSHHLQIKTLDELDELTLPSTTTLFDLLSRHLEICALVPRETILALSQVSSHPSVKEEFQHIGSSKTAYSAFQQTNHLTFARLLEYTLIQHPSSSWSKLPLSFLIDYIPPLQPRLYSIASSSIVEPRQASLVVSVKPDPLPGRPDVLVHGVTSTYLANTRLSYSEDCLVQAEVRRSTFKLPFSPQTPVIMVAAGTGIAPFRAFVQERTRLASIGRAVGPMLLFFGCQNKSNCLFYDEISDTASKDPTKFNLQLHMAFSQPGPTDSQRKAYVQDEVFNHRETVVKYLLEDDAAFYVCGATAMAKAVREVLLQAVRTNKEWSHEEVEGWRHDKKKDNRWQEDVWS